MIFIGSGLSDPDEHFVTNVVACIGSGQDLLIDLRETSDTRQIYNQIADHVADRDERFVIYNAYEDEDFFIGFKKQFPKLRLVTVFSDDEWRHANYDRYLALYADKFTIPVRENIAAYAEYGLKPFYMQWACNPDTFYPLRDIYQDIEVSFIGSAYGQRVDYLKFLIASGIKVRVYGKGWNRISAIRPFCGGYLSHKKALEVISRSKINLNFLWTSADRDRCTVKGRTLELSACRAFQLSNQTEELANYGYADGESIAVFRNKAELLEKIRYYLEHDSKREAIALTAYQHVLENHTWKQRFDVIFDQLGKHFYNASKSLPKYSILVLAHQGIQHQINCEDARLDIRIVDPDSDWHKDAVDMDGVISLSHNSSLTNESLYMMVFGLAADKAQVMASNFYLASRNNRHWIRFRDNFIDSRRKLLEMLPLPCLMFSSAYAIEHGCTLNLGNNRLQISYMEYPSFWIKLPYIRSRKLRLYFEFHRDPRQQLKDLVLGLKLDRALSLCMDKTWQKLLKN
jgi:hypothetical protein